MHFFRSAQIVFLISVALICFHSKALAAPTVIVTASSYENDGVEVHPPTDAYDNDFSTRWSAMGIGEWIQFGFSESVNINNLSIAFHRGNERSAYFSVNISNDGTSWTEVFNGQSSGISTGIENFTFLQSTTSFIRIVGNGNSANTWNSYTEVEFPFSSEPSCTDGAKNQDETGIDCGGICGGDCCANGYLDANMGEIGIDCGGSCGDCSQGLTYYISSSTGSDANNGLTESTAWQTIAKVNNAELAAGDSVLFKRGDTWREQLVIKWSGDAGAYIKFGTYGDGHKPRILGSEQAVDWNEVSGYPNIWRSGTQFDAPQVGHPGSIFFGEDDGTVTWGKEPGYSSVPACASDYSNLEQEYEWCYDDSNDAIYVYAPDDPDTRYDFIEVPQRRGSITMESHSPEEYIVIDGLELMFGTMYGYNDGWPMNYEASGLIIKNCHIGYIGIRGGDSAMGLVIWHSDMLVQNNDIHDCGRRSISYNIYTDNTSQPDGLVFENVIFENNTLHNGYHTTGFDISHGDGRASTLRNFVFRSNIVYDVNTDNPNNDPDDYTSMGLYLWAGAASFENFKVYDNVFKNVKQKLFAIGGGKHHNLEIFNNVLYGMNPNISDYRAQATISGEHNNLQYYNNIMLGTVDRNNYPCQNLYYGGNMDGVARMNNNIYYQLDSGQYIIQAATGSYHMDEWEDYRSDTGWDFHSPSPQDPLFVAPENNNFRLAPESAAIDAGRLNDRQATGNLCDIGLSDLVEPGVNINEQ